MIELLGVVVSPLITIGPPTVVLDRGEAYYSNPDAAFPYFATADGRTKVAIWAPGKPSRYIGTCLDDLAPSEPYACPVKRALGIGMDWDSAGAWMLAADRAPDGTLVAMVHAEDHTFSDGGRGEWNSSGVWNSEDDGRSWTNTGQVCGAAKPEKARFGGLDLRVMVWNRSRRSWLGYCGTFAFESKDPHALPGTWYGYHNGEFAQRIDPLQPAPPLSAAPGLPPDVSWGSLSWNAYFGKYLYVWWAPHAVRTALSLDGLHWEPPTTLYASDVPEKTLDYPTLIGSSSAQTGQDCLLVYAKQPATGLARKDMVERWIHFGPLRRPARPLGLGTSGRVSYEAAVTVTWKGVPTAQFYDVRRRFGNRPWTMIGTVCSSSAVPSFVDRAIAPGKIASYQVVARNSTGTSLPSEIASGGSTERRFRIRNDASGLFLEGESSGKVTLRPSMTSEAGQHWRFFTDDGRRYRIVNQATGLYLQNPGGSRVPGTLVGLRPNLSGKEASDFWTVQPAGPTLALINEGNGLCLDAFGEGNTPGTPIDIYPFRGAKNQRWRILD